MNGTEIVQPQATAPLRGSTNWKSVFATGVKVVVTIAVGTWVIRTVNWTAFSRQIAQVDPSWLATAFAVMGIATGCGAIRWWFLLRVQRIDASATQAVRLTMIGQFFNAFLIGSTGGDLAKIVYATGIDPARKAPAVISVLCDRALGLVALMVCPLLILPVQLGRWRAAESTRLLPPLLVGFALLVVIGGLILLFFPFHRLPESWQRLWRRLPMHTHAADAVIAVRDHRKAPRFTAGALVFAAMLPAFLLLAAMSLSRALHLEAPASALLVALPVALFMSALPISVGGLGVREGAFVIFFSLYDIGGANAREAAVAFSLVWYGLTLGWSAVGGLVFLLTRRVSTAALPSGTR